jgi:YVTN family beta-propeller protein
MLVHLRQESVYVRRRRIVAALALALAVALVVAVVGLVSLSRGGGSAVAQEPGQPVAAGAAPSDEPSSGSSAAPSEAPSAAPSPTGHRSDRTRLQRVDRITGAITPKSVVSSQHGVVIANNMMYSHTVTAYDARTRKLLATIPDSVDLSEFGVKGHPGTSQGAPVEGAFTKDGRYAYVSNYSMYGNGFGPHGLDVCSPKDGYDASYLYRIDTKTMSVDQVIKVGAVPKYVAITPDQTKVLVTNWCDYTLSIVDRATAKEIATVKIGPMPRGIAIAPDGKTAYVTAMWTDHVYEVDLTDPPKQAPIFVSPGDRMRHLDLSPDGRWLYGVSSGDNAVFKIDTRTGKVVDRASTGAEPRSMAISPDGRALYVVNYDEATLSKIRTSDMKPIGKVQTDIHPIGVTYVPATSSVWVACYGGSILVFDDSELAKDDHVA